MSYTNSLSLYPSNSCDMKFSELSYAAGCQCMFSLNYVRICSWSIHFSSVAEITLTCSSMVRNCRDQAVLYKNCRRSNLTPRYIRLSSLLVYNSSQLDNHVTRLTCCHLGSSFRHGMKESAQSVCVGSHCRSRRIASPVKRRLYAYYVPRYQL